MLSARCPVADQVRTATDRVTQILEGKGETVRRVECERGCQTYTAEKNF